MTVGERIHTTFGVKEAFEQVYQAALHAEKIGVLIPHRWKADLYKLLLSCGIVKRINYSGGVVELVTGTTVYVTSNGDGLRGMKLDHLFYWPITLPRMNYPVALLVRHD